MKLMMTSIVLFSSLLSSALTFAECTANRNADIDIEKPDAFYTDHGDGTVTDRETGLMWQKCSLGLSGNDCATGAANTFTWQAALAVAYDNADNGYTDWRLPNKNELASLLEGACDAPTINSTLFPGTISTINTYYWSSTPYSDADSWTWAINFHVGRIDYVLKDSGYYVRLVRDGS